MDTISITESDLNFNFFDKYPVNTVFEISKNEETITLAFKNLDDSHRVIGIGTLHKIDSKYTVRYFNNSKLDTAIPIDVKEHTYSRFKDHITEVFINYNYDNRYHEMVKVIKLNDIKNSSINKKFYVVPSINKYKLDIVSELMIILKYKNEDGVILLYQQTENTSDESIYWLEWVAL